MAKNAGPSKAANEITFFIGAFVGGGDFSGPIVATPLPPNHGFVFWESSP